MRTLAKCLVVISSLLSVAPRLVYAADSYPIATEFDVEAKMRDGTILRANVYRPKSEEKFPVLLERTPYDKRNSAGFARARRGAGLRGHHSGRPRPLQVRRRVVSVQE